MRVAGFGFRTAAPTAALAEALAGALARAGCSGQVDALATSHAKAGAPAIRELAQQAGLPLLAVEVAGIATPTQSPRVAALCGTGSLAEAAALAALAPGARLLAPRALSQDGMATCAIAQGDPA
ncbi:precorrin methylase [Paracoccus limosus]|uniref:Precorrin methylase n=1 Tax=Paracoccus limosus TaxID=913252 RepID=A0A844H3A8_9RHOB|nr:cobalamin biosynthesis protein [Paracoccus limosus]MTH34485.1 precorrin methylase [Paracoccus limosus]